MPLYIIPKEEQPVRQQRFFPKRKLRCELNTDPCLWSFFDTFLISVILVSGANNLILFESMMNPRNLTLRDGTKELFLILIERPNFERVSRIQSFNSKTTSRSGPMKKMKSSIYTTQRIPFDRKNFTIGRSTFVHHLGPWVTPNNIATHWKSDPWKLKAENFLDFWL